jgi:hypothetical protein
LSECGKILSVQYRWRPESLIESRNHNPEIRDS